jgi:predicted protein tyrosine phosphatase
MTILVCPLSKVHELVAKRAPERIVSLLDPERNFPQLGSTYAGKHLRLQFHDAHVATAGDVVPTAQHVASLLSFVTAWNRSGPILIHCRAGIGRSTATAFITACVHNPRTDEHEIALGLRRTAPLARPNRLLVELADAALGRSGRMCRAIEETGRGLSWVEVEAALRANGEGTPFELASSF